MSKYIVYLRTNTINGKQYVGQTNNLEQRNRQFNSLKCKCNKYLDEDRIKFGVDYFKVEVLAEVETREEACIIEKEYMGKLDTFYPKGYNRACSGKYNTGGVKGSHNSPSTEFKEGMTPWLKCRHHTEESKEKNRQAHLGTISEKRKPVIKFTLDWKYIKEYTHAGAAAQELGFKSDVSIRKACREEWRTSGGHRWMYKSDYEKMIGEEIAPPTIV